MPLKKKKLKRKTKKINFTADGDNDKDYDDDDDDDIFEYENEILKRLLNEVAEGSAELSAKENLGKIAAEACRSPDDDKKGYYYAAFYDKRYYWGKVLNVFADDVDNYVHSVEFLLLTYKMDSIWDFQKKKDQSIVAVKYVFLGPVNPSIVVTGNVLWFDRDNDKAQELLRLIKNYIANIIIIFFLNSKKLRLSTKFRH